MLLIQEEEAETMALNGPDKNGELAQSVISEKHFYPSEMRISKNQKSENT